MSLRWTICATSEIGFRVMISVKKTLKWLAIIAWGAALAMGALLLLDYREAVYDPDWLLGILWLLALFLAIAITTVYLAIRLLAKDHSFRFSMRALFIIVTIVAAVLGIVVSLR